MYGISIEDLFFIGISLTGGWVLLLVLTNICQWAIAWTDDKKKGKNVINKFILVRLYGKYEKYYDAEDVLFLVVLGPIFVMFFIPTVLYYAWELVLFIVCLIGLAFFVRFARRNKKMFDAHAKDKNAHT